MRVYAQLKAQIEGGTRSERRDDVGEAGVDPTAPDLAALVVVLLPVLLGILRLEFTGDGSPVFPVALLIVGINALIAMLLPYTAESFPLRIPESSARV